MGLYEIVYDWCGSSDEFDSGEASNCFEEFVGTWTELQDYIREMKKNGCYNIVATFINDVETMEDGDDAEKGE